MRKDDLGCVTRASLGGGESEHHWSQLLHCVLYGAFPLRTLDTFTTRPGPTARTQAPSPFGSPDLERPPQTMCTCMMTAVLACDELVEVTRPGSVTRLMRSESSDLLEGCEGGSP